MEEKTSLTKYLKTDILPVATKQSAHPQLCNHQIETNFVWELI